MGSKAPTKPPPQGPGKPPLPPPPPIMGKQKMDIPTFDSIALQIVNLTSRVEQLEFILRRKVLMSPVEDGQLDSEGRVVDNSSDPKVWVSEQTCKSLAKNILTHLKALDEGSEVRSAEEQEKLVSSIIFDTLNGGKE